MSEPFRENFLFLLVATMFARKQRSFALSALLVGALISTSGCVGFTNWILWGIYGQRVPAEFEGLANQRVAVVCATKSTPFEPGQDTGAIARAVSDRKSV